MKNLVWENSLSVDVEEIDEDHRRLIELFNLLNQAVEEEQEADYIRILTEELLSCTEWHFRHEERLMFWHNYDGLQEHRAEHQELMSSIRTFLQRVIEGGGDLSNKELEHLENWLVGHILGADMDLGSYLSERV